MALEKIEVSDRIEVIENGCVQVRMKTAIIEDGKQISASYARHVIAPGEPYDAHESNRVKAVCAAVHTPEAIAAYQAQQAANNAP